MISFYLLKSFHTYLTVLKLVCDVFYDQHRYTLVSLTEPRLSSIYLSSRPLPNCLLANCVSLIIGYSSRTILSGCVSDSSSYSNKSANRSSCFGSGCCPSFLKFRPPIQLWFFFLSLLLFSGVSFI